MEFGRTRGNSGNFGKTQGNSVEFNGFCMALSMNSVGIPGGFWGNAGFSGKFGVWGPWGGFGRFGGSKGFCANSHILGVVRAIFWLGVCGSFLAPDFSFPTKERVCLGWIQEGFKGAFLQRHLNPIRGPFPGDSVRILGVCPAVSPTFLSVTPTLGL